MKFIKINKLLIAISGIKNLVIKQSQLTNNEKNILILIDRPGIGDIVLCLNGLYNFSKFINIKKQYNLFIAADRRVCSLLKNIDSIFGANLIELDFSVIKKFNIEVFNQNYTKLNEHNWEIIISMDRIGMYMKSLVIGLNYKSIICSEYLALYSPLENLYKYFLHKYKTIEFNNLALSYVHKVLICKSVICKAVLCKTGIDISDGYYQYRIPILYNSNYVNRKYCVICAGVATGHDNQYRVWNLEKFRDTIKYILLHTNLMVYIVGSKDDLKNNNEVYSMLTNEERVHNITAQTSFKEWVEVLRNAQFVFGNDSGYIHLAAILDTQAFVIAGYWNYGRFLPYEKDTDDIKAPIDIRIAKPECVLCNVVKHKCQGKRACDSLVKSRGIYKCIDDIEVEDAIKKLEPFLKKEGLYK